MASVAEHRQNLNDLVAIAQRDLRLIVDRYDEAEAARDALLAAMPTLIGVYGSAAATLAADWYDDLRDDFGAPGRFLALPTELPDSEASDVLVRWSVAPLFSATPDKAQTFARVAGGLQQFVTDASRLTVVRSSFADSAAEGWRRVTSGPCSFCQMLAEGGRVFTEDTPDFKAHKNCGCVAAPAFR